MFVAHDLASKGVWVHASTGKDLTWINPKWDCSATADIVRHNSGGTFIFGIHNSRDINGAWCDDFSTKSRNFICKGLCPPDGCH